MAVFNPDAPFTSVPDVGPSLIDREITRLTAPARVAPTVPTAPVFNPDQPFTPVPEPTAAPVTKVSGVMFDPKAEFQKLFTPEDLKSKTVEELDKEPDFHPVEFAHQFEGELNSDPIAKQRVLDIYKLREAPFRTTGDQLRQAVTSPGKAAGKVGKSFWEGSKGFLKGVGQAIDNISDTGVGGAFRLLGAASVGGPAGQRGMTEEGRTIQGKSAELLAATELAAVGTADLLRRGVRTAVDLAAGFDPTYESEFTNDDWAERLSNDVASKKALDETRKGAGEMVRALGAHVDELKAGGIEIRPEIIESMSPAMDITNLIPFGAGAKVGIMTKTGGRYAMREFATAATPLQASAFAKAVNAGAETLGAGVKGVGVGVEKAGDIANGIALKFKGTATILGSATVVTGAPISGAAIIVGGKLGGVAAVKTGRAIQAASAYVPGAVRVGADIGAEFVKGYGQGLLFTVPFMIGADAEEREALLGSAGLAGLARGGIRTFAHGKAGARIAAEAVQDKNAEIIFKEVNQASPPVDPATPYGTDQRLDAESARQIAKLDADPVQERTRRVDAMLKTFDRETTRMDAEGEMTPRKMEKRLRERDERIAKIPEIVKVQQNLLGWVKNLFKDSGVEFYATDDAGMRRQTGGQSGRGFTVKTGQTIAPDGTAKPLIRVFLNGDVESLPHEMLHALGEIDAPGYAKFRNEVNKTLSPDQKKSFEQIYNAVYNGGLPEAQWKRKLSPEEVSNEIAAELFSRTVLGEDLSGVSPSLRKQAATFTAKLLEEFGIPLGKFTAAQAKDFAPKGTKIKAGFSTLGLRPGVQAQALGQTFVQGLLKRAAKDALPAPTEKSAIAGGTLQPGQISRRPSTPPPSAGAAPITPGGIPRAPAPASPAATTPAVSPATPPNIRVTPEAQSRFAPIEGTSGPVAELAYERHAKDLKIDEAKAAAAATGSPEIVARVDELSNAIGADKPALELEYQSVKSDGSPGDPTPRNPRLEEREAAYLEEALGAVPEKTRRLVQKVIVPVRWKIRGGKMNLIAMSLDKVIANVQTIVKDSFGKTDAESLIPYDYKNGALTESGWSEVVKDIQDYSENQANGYRGDGLPLTIPDVELGLSVPRPTPGFDPVRIEDKKKADFLNLVQGIKLPFTSKSGGRGVPANLAAQKLAEVNFRKVEPPVKAAIRPQDLLKRTYKAEITEPLFPGRGPMDIAEPNPLRNQFSDAGVDTTKLHPVTEEISPENVARVTPRSDLNYKAPVTDIIRGGFLPTLPKLSPEAMLRLEPFRKAAEAEEKNTPHIRTARIQWANRYQKEFEKSPVAPTPSAIPPKGKDWSAARYEARNDPSFDLVGLAEKPKPDLHWAEEMDSAGKTVWKSDVYPTKELAKEAASLRKPTATDSTVTTESQTYKSFRDEMRAARALEESWKPEPSEDYERDSTSPKPRTPTEYLVSEDGRIFEAGEAFYEHLDDALNDMAVGWRGDPEGYLMAEGWSHFSIDPKNAVQLSSEEGWTTAKQNSVQGWAVKLKLPVLDALGESLPAFNPPPKHPPGLTQKSLEAVDWHSVRSDVSRMGAAEAQSKFGPFRDIYQVEDLLESLTLRPEKSPNSFPKADQPVLQKLLKYGRDQLLERGESPGQFLPGEAEGAATKFIKQKTTEQIGQEVLAASPEEWQRLTSDLGGLTGLAYKVGFRLKNAEDVAKLRQFESDAKTKYEVAKLYKDFDGMMLAATKKQFFTEALETATGMNPGKQATIARVLGPDWEPPFPEAPKGQLLPGGDFLNGVKEVIEKKISDYTKSGGKFSQIKESLLDSLSKFISPLIANYQKYQEGMNDAQKRAFFEDASRGQRWVKDSKTGIYLPASLFRELGKILDAVEARPGRVVEDILPELKLTLPEGNLKGIPEAGAFESKARKPRKPSSEFPLTDSGEFSGSFLPKVDDPRAVEFAAIRNAETGGIFSGGTHGEAMRKASRADGIPDREFSLSAAYAQPRYEQGFVTQGGEFLTRAQARTRVEEIGQIAPEDIADATQFGKGEKLESVGFQSNRKFLPGEETDAALRRGLLPDPKPSEPKPDASLRDLASEITGAAGIVYKPAQVYAPLKEDLSKKLADFYDKAESLPDSPEVKKSYKALVDETMTQYRAILAAGYVIEPFTGEGEPYKSSAEVISDIRDNKHLFVLTTEGKNFAGGADHPMLAPSGLKELPRENDVFRAVHDFFGHAKEGYQFGPRGEFNAWRSHAGMYSDEAQGALAAETLAQNSWVNFGPHLRGREKVPPSERPFAEQKAVVVPEELIDEARGQLLPAKRKRTPEERIAETDYSKYNVPVSKGRGPRLTGWILPSREYVPMDVAFHEQFLADQADDLNKRFGTKFGKTSNVEDRLVALNKGFVRIRGGLQGERRTGGTGGVVIEMNERFFPKVRGTLESYLLDNMESIDNLTVNLLNDRGGVKDYQRVVVHELEGAERANALLGVLDDLRLRGPEGKLLPGGEETLPGLNLPSEERAKQIRVKARVAKSKDKFPEALKLAYQKDEEGQFVLGEDGKPRPQAVEYALMETPLAREAAKGLKGEARQRAVAAALGDKLEREAKAALKRPDLEDGRRWYSTARTRLKGLFGEDSKFFAELLAATSARTAVDINYRFALGAYNKFKLGEFDSIIEKYRQGKADWESGRVKDFLKENPKNDNPTRGQFLDWYVEKYNLIPTQSNGKRFGANSRAVLRVLDGSWRSEVQGPKTPNFMGNLTGESFKSTIDVWAARALHRLANEGSDKPWRILPELETGVTEADFEIGQAAFDHAAKNLAMRADSLQALIWFSEKDFWERHGWARGASAAKSDFNVLLKNTEPGPGGTFRRKNPQLGLALDLKASEIKKR